MPKDKRYVLRAPTGETIITASLDGHDDCELLGTTNGEPHDDHRWSARRKAFVRCADASEARVNERRQTIRLLREELDQVLNRLARLEQVVASLQHPTPGDPE